MKFNIIYADPPWRFSNWSMRELAERGEKWARRMGKSPYNVMDLEDIMSLPVEDIAEKDCVLFLWATLPMIDKALKVIEAWGFTYKATAFVWAKLNPKGVGWWFGLGYWTRANAEICLLATRGRPKRVNNKVSQLVVSPRREHSRKPDEVRDRIVQLMGDLPRVELFASEYTPGWLCLGDKVTGRDIQEDLRALTGRAILSPSTP